MKICTLLVSSLLLTVVVGNSYATTYSVPHFKGDRVVASSTGETVTITVEQDQTLLDIAKRFNLGQTEIVTINPGLDRWLIKKGTVVRLPNRRILPDSPHEGITLNVAEYRMYYYPADQPGTVRSYAHGVGRQDWKTPLGKTSIIKKVKDPAWHPPESIRREHAANGDPLPEIVPPGPHNPLGAYALYLNLPGDYRIHGTDIDKIFGIGMQITHGCVRMYPEDISALYQSVAVGTSVYIVKQPVKVGWLNNVLYVEAHPDLEGEEKTQDERYAIALNLLKQENNQVLPDFDQVVLNKVLTDLDGTPTPVYERLPPLEGEMIEPVAKAVPVAKVVASAAASKKPVAVVKGKVKDLAVSTKKTKPAALQAANNAKKIPEKAATKPTKSKRPVTETASNSQSTGSVGGYYHGN
jgi:L,D-transpeptidase ErfK/SrfK